MQVQLHFNGGSRSRLPRDKSREAAEPGPAVKPSSTPDRMAFVSPVRGSESRTPSARAVALSTGPRVAGKDHGAIKQRAAIKHRVPAKPRTAGKAQARARKHVLAQPRTSPRNATTAVGLGPSGGRRYFVQLGAFSKHVNAVRAKKKLTVELSGILRHHGRLLAVVASKNGGLSRVLFTHAFRTRRAAAALCAALKARGPDCDVTVGRAQSRPAPAPAAGGRSLRR